MKIYAFTFLVWAICVKGFSQASDVDALEKQLAVAKHDTDRAMILAEISNFYRLISTDTGLTTGYKALQLARHYHFKKGECAALNSIAQNYLIKGDLVSSMPPLLEAIRLAQTHHLPAQLAEAMISMGNTYFSLQDYPTAIRYFKDAIEMRKHLALPLRRSLGMTVLGEAFMMNGQLDLGQYYLDSAYEIMKEERYPTGINFYYTRSARLNLLKKNYKAAYSFIKEAERLNIQEKNTRSQLMVYQLYSKYYQAKNDIDSAIYYSHAAFELAKKHTYQWDILTTSRQLSELYESKDLPKAFFFSQFSSELNDSLYGPRRLVSVLQQSITQEQEKIRETEARGLAEKNRLKQNALITGLGITALIGLFLYRNNREKQRTNNLLSEQKAEIEKQKNQVENTLKELKSTQAQLIQSEKMASLGELTAGIAHEIQNPLNFVNNFSEVNNELIEELKSESRSLKSEDEAEKLEAIYQNNEKIKYHGKRADAIVKGMLQHSRTSAGQKEPTDINALADEYMRLSYHGMRARDKSFNAQLETHFDPSIGKVSVIPQDIGRVLLNLYNNAFYAVKEKKILVGKDYESSVSVNTEQSNSKIKITIKDNGTGIPVKFQDKIFQPFFTTKPTGQGTGLGLSLAYDIIKTHGGEIKVVTDEGKGTEFIIYLPV